MKQIHEGPYIGLTRTDKPVSDYDDSEWRCGFPDCDGSCFVPDPDPGLNWPRWWKEEG
jgi:hypothetical protein